VPCLAWQSFTCLLEHPCTPHAPRPRGAIPRACLDPSLPLPHVARFREKGSSRTKLACSEEETSSRSVHARLPRCERDRSRPNDGGRRSGRLERPRRSPRGSATDAPRSFTLIISSRLLTRGASSAAAQRRVRDPSQLPLALPPWRLRPQWAHLRGLVGPFALAWGLARMLSGFRRGHRSPCELRNGPPSDRNIPTGPPVCGDQSVPPR
jgi:hypothetical protein